MNNIARKLDLRNLAAYFPFISMTGLYLALELIDSYHGKIPDIDEYTVNVIKIVSNILVLFFALPSVVLAIAIIGRFKLAKAFGLIVSAAVFWFAYWQTRTSYWLIILTTTNWPYIRRPDKCMAIWGILY